MRLAAGAAGESASLHFQFGIRSTSACLIEAQEGEIAMMKKWLAEHSKWASAAVMPQSKSKAEVTTVGLRVRPAREVRDMTATSATLVNPVGQAFQVPGETICSQLWTQSAFMTNQVNKSRLLLKPMVK
ncbi:hypothetical protein [Ensifer sp. LCM 4579]|uniref:hypothetical protein n=1 Tax=Ensifer sp. LCM 4579 TaxID=1848292 RepID=UPI0008D9F36F|nr:hypothetical protein [Ensifer sp. LCM 4579]OHV78198.1 hypothetical protein LCM4579_27040 [Ensifer sp. LCM 4579]